MPEQTPTQSLAPLPATSEKTPVRFGLMPTSLEEGWRVAQMMARSELVPKNFRNKAEDILVAMQMGAEVGLAPMQALQSIAVINGRPGLWGDGLLALIVRSPLYQDHDEFYEVDGERRDGLTPADLAKDTTAAVCVFVRQGKAAPVSRRFSIAQAKKAQLLGKDGPWQTYPDRMLSMRARSWAARDAFPDLLRGIRTAEELYDVPAEDATPPMRLVRRLSTPVETPEAAAADVMPGVTAPEAPPAPKTETIGPAKVRRVENLLGGPCVFLADGTQIWLTSAEDAAELAKFIGTDHLLTFVVVPVDGHAEQWRAQSFAIAD